jgi:hypothetical protein
LYGKPEKNKTDIRHCKKVPRILTLPDHFASHLSDRQCKQMGEKFLLQDEPSVLNEVRSLLEHQAVDVSVLSFMFVNHV